MKKPGGVYGYAHTDVVYTFREPVYFQHFYYTLDAYNLRGVDRSQLFFRFYSEDDDLVLSYQITEDKVDKILQLAQYASLKDWEKFEFTINNYAKVKRVELSRGIDIDFITL